MGVDENGIGFSDWTKEKQRIFRSLLRINLMMWNSILNDNRKYYYEGSFTYFDITAGCGVHDEYGDGSPIIFLKEIRNFGHCWVAHFWDKNKINTAKLEVHCNYLPENKRGYYNIATNDHNKLLVEWSRDNPNRVPGLLYCDPTGQIPPFETLAIFSRTWTKVDLLIAFSATNKKRAKVAHGHKSLIEEIKSINKNNFMIRAPYGMHQWTFLYMTDGPSPRWKRESFYEIDSDEGKEILTKLTYTEDELNANQPALFDLSRISSTP